jgi:hypothetical protein
MPLRQYKRAASGPGGCHLAMMPAFGQGDATLPGAFRPCRSSRLRRFAPLRASQALRSWGPGSALAESAPIGVLPATDPGVHAVSAPAAVSAGLPIRPGAFRRQSRKNREPRAAFSGASPVMPYPSKRSPRQQPSRRHRRALPSRRYRALRWSKRQLRAALSDSAGVCRPQGLAPLPKSGGKVAVASGPAPMLPWASSWRGRVEDASAEAERTSRSNPR